jgi:UDP-glucose 4-epimerase
MRVLVTGAAGYVGSHLINKLLEDEKFADYEIVGIDNFLVGNKKNYELIKKDKRVNLMYGDICGRDFIKDVLKDVEIVYHLAAISDVIYCNKNPTLAFKVNVEGTLNMLEQSAKNNVEYFVYPSSAAVYGEIKEDLAREDMLPNPLNNYGAMKVSCEALCKAYYNSYGLGTIILRFTNIYGVGTYPKWITVITNFIKRALMGEPLIIYGSGEQKRDFVHIDDVIEIYKLIIDPKVKGEIFNAGSGYVASVKEIANIVVDIAKKKCIEAKISFEGSRESKERAFAYDIHKMKSLGFKPKYNIESGIKKTFSDVKRILRSGFKEYQKISIPIN